jgi:hypothetical protein
MEGDGGKLAGFEQNVTEERSGKTSSGEAQRQFKLGGGGLRLDQGSLGRPQERGCKDVNVLNVDLLIYPENW